MIASILVPDLPSLALQMALGTHKQLLVFAAGRVVAPYELAGMPIDRARALRPYACTLTRRPGLEKAAWDHITEQVFSFTPYISEGEMGRLFCAPDNMQALRTLVENTHARVGIAQTRSLALLASLAAKPGGIVTIDDDDVARFLDGLPLHALTELPELELDAAIIQRLQLFGFSTVGRIRRLTRSQLQDQFGKPGIKIHQFLHSLTDRTPLPLFVPPPHVRVDVPAHEPTNEPADLEVLLQEALAQSMVLLGHHRCSRAELTFHDASGSVVACRSRVLRAPTSDPRHLLVQTTAMLLSMISRNKVASLSVRLSSLSITPPTQTVLFQRQPSSTDVNATMVRRYPNAIKKITVMDTNAYLPDRFATIDQWKPTS